VTFAFIDRLFRGYRATADRERDGGAEDVVGVVKLFDLASRSALGPKLPATRSVSSGPSKFGYPPGSAIALKVCRVSRTHC
jgi:hypothetical protein